MLVLSPSKVTLYTRQAAQWESKRRLSRWRPRSRGRATCAAVCGSTVRVSGLSAGHAVQRRGGAGAGTLDCRPSDEPWVLESGSRALLLANFAAARNYFDGRVITQTGLRKTVAPFYSAASVEEQGRTLWLLAMVDGRTQIFDAAFDPAGSIAVVGQRHRRHRCALRQRIAGAGHAGRAMGQRRCHPGIRDRESRGGAAHRPVDFPGPVTALWPSAEPRRWRSFTTWRRGGMRRIWYGVVVVGKACQQTAVPRCRGPRRPASDEP